MKGKIFNSKEVQAIIAGKKTMFREVVSNAIYDHYVHSYKDWYKDGWYYPIATMVDKNNKEKETQYDSKAVKPKFQVGQKIFVKEAFGNYYSQVWYKSDYNKEISDKYFWKPARHMKQEHSRLTLRIKSVKVERLQDISEEDFKKEGIGYTGGWNGEDYDDGEYYFGKLIESEEGIIENTTEMFQFCDRFACKNEMFEYEEDAFEVYWNSNRKKQEQKWEANPWVFAYEFEIINFNK